MNDFITINTNQTTTKIIEYQPYSLVNENDPILKKPTFNVDFSGSLNVKEIVGRLIETIKKTKAFGIAAPQCGLPHSIIIIGANEEYVPLINPEIISSSEETVHMEEGCLSFPFLTLSISRPKTVTVKFQDETGSDKTLTFSGLSARIIQHEIDHIRGITFDSVVKPLALKQGLKRRDKKMKQFARYLVSQRKLQNT